MRLIPDGSPSWRSRTIADSRSASVRGRDRADASEVLCPAGGMIDSGSSCDPHEGQTGPPFRQTHHGLKMRDTFALGGGPYHFFDRSYSSDAGSNICYDIRFFCFVI